ncbi:MAG: hypothetical protein WAU47_04180, partial [Desulfobaccales bacterium]
MVLAVGAGSCNAGAEVPLVIFASPDSPRMRQAVAGLKNHLAPRTVEVAAAPEFGPAGDKAVSRIRAQRPPLL